MNERLANTGADEDTMIKYWSMMDPISHSYAWKHSVRLTPAQQGLLEVTYKQRDAHYLSSADELQFLHNLVKTIKGKKTIDIGVYTGYSALTIALALPDDGKLIALDIDAEMPEVGRPFWREAGVEHKIDLMIGKATDSLEKLCADKKNLGSFDFVFIDADKPNLRSYYEYSLKLIRSGGIIAVDNMLWSGQVAHQKFTSEKTQAIRDLAKFLYEDNRVDVSMLLLAMEHT